MASTHIAPVNLPRVAITYCTQCRWMLRAAYFGQELLLTFGNQIGEIALIPATGGLFQVELTYISSNSIEQDGGDVKAKKVLLWDRKTEGGFPETKVLKQRVRDRIDPKKDLGHSDVGGKKKDAVRSESEKTEYEKIENEKIENEKIENEKIENEKIENEKIENEKTENEKTGKDGKVEKVEVKVDGQVEKNAEGMVKYVVIEDVHDERDIKRNPDGTVCEDCR